MTAIIIIIIIIVIICYAKLLMEVWCQCDGLWFDQKHELILLVSLAVLSLTASAYQSKTVKKIKIRQMSHCRQVPTSA